MASSKTIAARSGPMRSELVRVTPDLARKWLAKNVHNRNVRGTVIKNYARDIKAGHWLVTGEAIKFNGDGTLLDGQHRLLAVIEANTPAQMFVIRGLSTNAQDVMDTGSKRSGHDALNLNGYSYASLLAAATRLAINWEAGLFEKARQTLIAGVTHSEVLTFVAANSDLVELANRVGADWCVRIPAKPAVTLFTAWATARIDADLSQQFYSDLAEYHTSGAGDPRAALLRRLNAIVRDRERTAAPQQADLFFRAWNAVRAKKSITKFAQNFTSEHNFTDPK